MRPAPVPQMDPAVLKSCDEKWAELVRENNDLKEELLDVAMQRNALRAENDRLRAGVPSVDRSDIPTASAVSDHSQCHDLVCNGDTRQPRGAKGVCCSCRGRDAAYVQRNELLAACEAFMAKWAEVEPAINSAFTMSFIHGGRYNGPTLVPELRQMREAIQRAKAEGQR